jgi:hypothetical protein
MTAPGAIDNKRRPDFPAHQWRFYTVEPFPVAAGGATTHDVGVLPSL